MKAINVDQPWAELIMLGIKRMELRNSRTSQRGRIAIRATQTVLEDQCRRFDLDPEELPVGLILGSVELVEVIQMDQERWIEMRAEHLSEAASPGEWRYGWRIKNPRRLATPIRYRGLPGMFDLPDEIARIFDKET